MDWVFETETTRNMVTDTGAAPILGLFVWSFGTPPPPGMGEGSPNSNSIVSSNPLPPAIPSTWENREKRVQWVLDNFSRAEKAYAYIMLYQVERIRLSHVAVTIADEQAAVSNTDKTSSAPTSTTATPSPDTPVGRVLSAPLPPAVPMTWVGCEDRVLWVLHNFSPGEKSLLYKLLHDKEQFTNENAPHILRDERLRGQQKPSS